MDSINEKFNNCKLQCGHCFHLNCIYVWLNKNNTCPLCRKEQLLKINYNFIFEIYKIISLFLFFFMLIHIILFLEKIKHECNFIIL